jgi:hypothetical protein
MVHGVVAVVRSALGAAAVVGLAVGPLAGPAGGAPAGHPANAAPVARLAAAPPSVLTVGQVAAQDVPALPGSEPDTLVEPDVAVSPVDPRVAVAAAHDGRYPNGGAVGISYAWTADGGRTWQHRPLPGVTSATGGEATWARATDPVVAFDHQGRAYVSTLLFNLGCDSAVAVSRSTDGGRTFGAPVLAHRSADCAEQDDKNWLVVDTSADSPHRGRLYQFWTPFLTDMFGSPDGSPQAVIWSDDHGETWSRPVAVSPPHANTQNSQAMVLPDGTVVDAYVDFGATSIEEGAGEGLARLPEAAQARRQRVRPGGPRATVEPPPMLVTRISRDGGRTWTDGGLISSTLGEGPVGIRCCLPSATVDPVTGRMYAAWVGMDPRELLVSTSTDGGSWSSPRRVNRGSGDAQAVNVDVSAYGGTLGVTYGLTNPDINRGRYAHQYVATSRDHGAIFSPAVVLGPRIDYAYAAQAGGIFPGDYIGSAMRGDRMYAVWCVSSNPHRAGARFHQVVYGATLDTGGAPRGRA